MNVSTALKGTHNYIYICENCEKIGGGVGRGVRGWRARVDLKMQNKIIRGSGLGGSG